MELFKRVCLAAAALALITAPAFAHHGTSGSYDSTKVVKIDGTVKEFRWRNPHSALFIVSKNAAGAETTYALEMGSPATMARAGYTASSFKFGDKVQAEMHPSFTNPANGFAPLTLHMVVNGKAMRTAANVEPQ
jgi:hypothetical protein